VTSIVVRLKRKKGSDLSFGGGELAKEEKQKPPTVEEMKLYVRQKLSCIMHLERRATWGGGGGGGPKRIKKKKLDYRNKTRPGKDLEGREC